MKTIPSTVAGLATEPMTSPASLSRVDRKDRRPQRIRPLMRKYEVAYLSASGDVMELNRLAPAISPFEDGFASFGRGTILSTDKGPRAIEDLLPGDRVMTCHNGAQCVRWIGSMTVIPGAAGQSPHMGTMTRLAADAFGLGRPMPDLMLGPLARILHRSPAFATRLGVESAYVPARSFIDGSHVIEITPMSPVRVFHIATDRQESVLANGMAIETFHPGRMTEFHLSDDHMALYLSLFPHIADLSEFGPLTLPRVTDSRLLAGAA